MLFNGLKGRHKLMEDKLSEALKWDGKKTQPPLFRSLSMKRLQSGRAYWGNAAVS